MKKLVDKLRIITYKEEGKSNREVSRIMGIDRKTVSKYWNDYKRYKNEINKPKIDIQDIQEKIVEKPTYDSSNRKRRKFTAEIEEKLNEILESEKEKDKILGSHKQQLTKVEIHEQIVSEGFDISLSTISNAINEIRRKSKECFIRQKYDLGDRLEYDFGEVKLEIDDRVNTYHMAVLSSPGGEFRWAYLYTNQKKEVFMDSHVQFFEMVKGTYKEVVYDNMKNVVSRFIGRNEKELNEDLVKLSIYYGFQINVTNCFSGNEKGYVESSVKILRKKIFSKNYSFNSLDDAREYLNSQLIKINESSKIEEEKKYLLPYLPKLEIGNISENQVNTYSFIRYENNQYSVPEYLVGKKVTVKSYYDKICIYSHNNFVCQHNKLEGAGKISVNIEHYLKTLYKKPGAIRNSLALKSIPKLKQIYDKYYSTKPRQFIKIFIDNKDKTIPEIIAVYEDLVKIPQNILAIDVIGSTSDIFVKTKEQITGYNALCIKRSV